MRLLFVLTLLFPLGCQHMVINRADPPRALGESHEMEIDSFFRGALPATKIPPEKEVCPKSRIENVELRMSGSDVLLSIVTLGIYVPHRVILTCAKEVN